MEGWRSYNYIKNVLPDKISGVEEPVRRLSEKDFDCVSQNDGISIYETELLFGTGSAGMERWMKLDEKTAFSGNRADKGPGIVER